MTDFLMIEYPYYTVIMNDELCIDNLSREELELEIIYGLNSFNRIIKYVAPYQGYFIYDVSILCSESHIYENNDYFYKNDPENIPFNPFDIQLIKRLNKY